MKRQFKAIHRAGNAAWSESRGGSRGGGAEPRRPSFDPRSQAELGNEDAIEPPGRSSRLLTVKCQPDRPGRPQGDLRLRGHGTSSAGTLTRQLRATVASTRTASIMAKWLPMQTRGPPPKGKYAKLGRRRAASSAQHGLELPRAHRPAQDAVNDPLAHRMVPPGGTL